MQDFSAEIAQRLAEWSYPSAASVRYDRNELDIITGDQPRSAHGEGVRAILHAAFTLALAQYCFDRELPHPGFVVLDSLLVNYRPPDQSTEIIIMENTDPLEPLGAEAREIRSTKQTDVGRYGFLPVVDEEESSVI